MNALSRYFAAVAVVGAGELDQTKRKGHLIPEMIRRAQWKAADLSNVQRILLKAVIATSKLGSKQTVFRKLMNGLESHKRMRSLIFESMLRLMVSAFAWAYFCFAAPF